MIALVRIDDRLVHGQVVVGWIPHVRPDEVVVVSDTVAQDPTQTTLMQMALPEGVGLRAVGFKGAARYFSSDEAQGKRILLLAPTPFEVLGMLDEGAKFDRVNVGGMHYTTGAVQLGKAIFLSELDKEALREIARRGVRLEGRAIPGDKETDILSMIGRDA